MINYAQPTLWTPIVDDVQVQQTGKLSSFLKWAGGKEQELKYILPLIPSFDAYYEPFVGSGAVFFSMQSSKKYINDKSSELFHLYMMIAQSNKDFFDALDKLLMGWQNISRIVDNKAVDLIKIYKSYSTNVCSLDEMTSRLLSFVQDNEDEFKNMFEVLFNKDTENFIRELRRNLLSKTKRMKELEKKKWKLPDHDIVSNIEGALKSAFYMHLRYLYNNILKHKISDGLAAAIFFFVRENAYASMFRYNSRGEFNVPYGGLSYNRKDLAKKIVYMRSLGLQRYLKNTVIENMDFEEFLMKYPPKSNDFIFLDPPYDSEFSTYAQNEFTMREQERLAQYLLTHCKAKFMLVIKNTPAILNLYSQPSLNISMFDKKYLVSFQARNDREVEHLIITNY